MFIIPPELLNEWESAYYDMLETPGDHHQIIIENNVTLVSYLSHCSAMWAYTQALSISEMLNECLVME
jgi:hypothetical protein